MSALFSERRVVGLIILVLTVGLVASTFGLQFADLGGAFSPMFFPRIILMILLALAAMNMVLDFLVVQDAKPIRLGPVAIIAAAFVGYVFIVIPLGYFVSSVLVGVVILLALDLRNPLKVLAIPVLGAGGLVLLFNHVLKMPLPTSPLFWWI